MSDTRAVLRRLCVLFVAALSITLVSGAYGRGFGVTRASSAMSIASGLTYQPFGPLTVAPASGSAVVRGYNQAERLANVTVGGTQTAGYVYDAFGRRASKVLAKSGSVYLYDVTGHMLEEASQTTGALVTDNIFLNGAPVAQVTPSALFFIHPDRLGTPQLATTTQGAVAWRGVFQPFGVNTGNKGILVQKLRFPGQYADAETGDNQNGFRDYDPSLGRYLETDPIGIAGGLNGFVYAGSNPLNVTDRMGLCPPCVAAAVIEAGELAAEVGEAVEAAEAASAAAEEAGTAETAKDLSDAASREQMSQTGSTIDPADKSGMLSKAGRSLQKKAGRPGSSFDCPSGNKSAVNSAGQNALDDILNNPASKTTPTASGRFPGGTDVTAPNGQGARFDSSGKFVGFLEPPQ